MTDLREKIAQAIARPAEYEYAGMWELWLESADAVIAVLREQEPVQFLVTATHHKVSYDKRHSDARIYGLPPELNGRWVALVVADDDAHLRLVAPMPASVPEDLINAIRENVRCFRNATTGEVRYTLDRDGPEWQDVMIIPNVSNETVDWVLGVPKPGESE